MAHFEGFYNEELVKNANQLCDEGKGILAADDTPEELFAKHNIENNEENRRAFHELLCFAPGSNDYLSGIILDDENFHQINHFDGKPFIDTLEEWGILPGIRLDTGSAQLPCTDETLTQGLDGLAERCRTYYTSGARFATWRAEFTIGLLEPTDLALATNSQALGLFAFFCQDNGLVPLVQTDILVNGKHDIQECAHVTETVLSWVIKALSDHRVMLEGALLMLSMVMPGSESDKVEPDVMAKHTLEAIQRTVPPAIPGIFFLSGEQTEKEATINLNAIGKINYGKKPWAISFSFGDALQDSALKAWGGNNENWSKGQSAAYKAYHLNSKASYGYYRSGNGYGSSDDEDYSSHAYTNDDTPNNENESPHNENEGSRNEEEGTQNEQEGTQNEQEGTQNEKEGTQNEQESTQKEEEK